MLPVNHAISAVLAHMETPPVTIDPKSEKKPVNGDGSANKRAITMTAVGTVVATVVGLTTIHSTFILPVTVAKAKAEAEAIILRAIQEHAQHPHKDAISKDAFKLIREDIRQLQQDVKELLRR